MLPANVPLQREDLGYFSYWNKWDFGLNTNHTPESNYKAIKELKVIAFARKIMKINYNEYLNVAVECKTYEDRQKFIDLANKYGFNPAGKTFLSFHYSHDCFIIFKDRGDIYPTGYNKKDLKKEYNAYLYEAPLNWQEIENHIKYDINNIGPYDFQILLKDEKEVNEFIDLGEKYGFKWEFEENLKRVNVYYLITEKNKIEWNYNKECLPDRRTISFKNKTKIEEILKNNAINMKTEIDYKKYPNIALKIENDENARVMFIALAEKYGFKLSDIDHRIKNYIFAYKKAIETKGRYERYGDSDLYGYSDGSFISNDNFHIYETPDWPAIIKHFEAKIEPEIPIVNGYKMEFVKGNNVVKFGCANIPISTFEYLIYDYPFGNRKIKSITLDSGVTITKEEAIKVIVYIKTVNNQS